MNMAYDLMQKLYNYFTVILHILYEGYLLRWTLLHKQLYQQKKRKKYVL